jgi:hypothetical protein
MRVIAVFCLVACLFSCDEGTLVDALLVYQNDMEIDSLNTALIGARTHTFDESQVLGPYHNSGFTVFIEDLPKHDVILITFDLYAHDSWDGNLEGVGGPDYFEVMIDELEPRLPSPFVFRTTFSNANCDEVRCLYQSFPLSYPHRALPRTGRALNKLLPGRCSKANNQTNGSILFPVQIQFDHAAPLAILRFQDRLRQTNTANPSCDESWSLDNLKVYALDY